MTWTPIKHNVLKIIIIKAFLNKMIITKVINLFLEKLLVIKDLHLNSFENANMVTILNHRQNKTYYYYY